MGRSTRFARFGVLAVCFGLSSLSMASYAGAQDDDTLEWLDDYDEAFALAKRTGKPVFLEFRCAP